MMRIWARVITFWDNWEQLLKCFGPTDFFDPPNFWNHRAIETTIDFLDPPNFHFSLPTRYPIHFHMEGNVNKSYVEGCAVHRSFNRAITIHGTQQLRVERNVVYDIMGKKFGILGWETV